MVGNDIMLHFHKNKGLKPERGLSNGGQTYREPDRKNLPSSTVESIGAPRIIWKKP